MIEATVNWTDKDRFLGLASSRHSMVMDAGSEKTANSPMELVLIALCGCTGADVVSILRKKREKFTALEITAKGERAEGYPAVYTSIHLTYKVTGDVSKKGLEDAVRLSEEKYCSVSAMLQKSVKITYSIEHMA
jgi:putative redox protein